MNWVSWRLKCPHNLRESTLEELSLLLFLMFKEINDDISTHREANREANDVSDWEKAAKQQGLEFVKTITHND